MGEMYGFAEASAVHFRVEYYQDQGDKREYGLKADDGWGNDMSPDSGNQACTEYGLGECQDGSEYFCCRLKGAQVYEIKVFLDDESGSYGIHELEDSRYEEYKACDKSTESFHAMQQVSHLSRFYGCLFYCRVYNLPDFGKNCSWR